MQPGLVHYDIGDAMRSVCNPAGEDATEWATMVKLKSGRLMREVTDTCVQFWGGMGFADGRVSRAFRDGRLASIGGGADEVMLGILAKTMGIAKRPQA